MAPKIAKLLSSSAVEGNSIKFHFYLTARAVQNTILDFSWLATKPDLLEWSDYKITATSGVVVRPVMGKLVVPKGVQSFTISIDTTKDSLRETSEYIGIGVDGQSAWASALDIAYDPAKWWRSTDWFQDWLFESSWRGRCANDGSNFGNSVRQAFSNFDKMSYERYFDSLATLLEVWLSGKASGNYKPQYNLTFTGAAVLLIGRVFDPVGYDPLIRNDRTFSKPNKNEIILIGDSLSDEKLTGWRAGNGYESHNFGVWARQLRKEVDQPGCEWSLWNLAQGSAATSGPDKFNATRMLSNALIENPTPGLVIINIGVNNLWANLSLDTTQKDVDVLVSKALSSGAKVVLVGTYLPPKRQEPSVKVQDETDRAFLQSKFGHATAHDWSLEFNERLDLVAAKYERTFGRNFEYVENFWYPLDGSIRNVWRGDEMQTARHLLNLRDDLHPDGIHPLANERVEQRLYANIRPAIDALIDF